jgi:hypothetical protein
MKGETFYLYLLWAYKKQKCQNDKTEQVKIFECASSCLCPGYVQTAGDNRIMHEPEDQGELKIQCESPVPADDLMTHIQFVEEGWELKGDYEGLDTEQDEGNIFEMPTFLKLCFICTYIAFLSFFYSLEK